MDERAADGERRVAEGTAAELGEAAEVGGSEVGRGTAAEVGESAVGLGEAVPPSTRQPGPLTGEETPSAEEIGREFVRQYYTILTTQPRYVHLFYSHDSTYVCGKDGNGDGVKGKAAIQREIASLGINSCSAKILSVDSAETLDNGVLIQVVGNLNINGQGNERFLQTFVLAAGGSGGRDFHVRTSLLKRELTGLALGALATSAAIPGADLADLKARHPPNP